MTLIKSSMTIIDKKYPQDDWVELIQDEQLKHDEPISKSKLIAQCGKKVLKEKFNEIVARKIELEKQYGAFIYFDVILNEETLSLDNCDYQIILETFKPSEVAKINLVSGVYIPDFNQLSSSKLEEYALEYNPCGSKKMSKDELNQIKRWYKHDIYAKFFREIRDLAIENFDIIVSDHAIERWNRVNKTNYEIDIKKTAYISKINLELDAIKLNEVNAVSKFIEIKVKLEHLTFENEIQKNDIPREWIMEVIYGKKIMSKFFPALYRATVTW
ncbi:hypothetical protein NPA07_00905 [Mycoplasmopsis caviae]|uniref:Uncharacterized protein n=1 Tax=Mycoplasmopsis caviae TaxID=55603 RepID=A0A3P8L6W9_9BACT|nr:hypothetical protein [Mycoplasmopsis caviae]UUD35420.1 hypothetical protein NPA07_00905 [Mycoplasmopsis caviae]VDR41805.1 Uncharacterised protein [Mycoplasmopsis caviae]